MSHASRGGPTGGPPRPLQNRVTPLGDLIADPARGLVYGNRGCLHDAGGEIRRQWQVKRWIACRLEFKDRQRGPKMQPGRYTELFFLDEATAFAAGHRPCAECRRADYVRFLELGGGGGADEVDARLHAERLDGRERRLHRTRYRELPDGAFVLEDGTPFLVFGERLLEWTPAGYVRSRVRLGGWATAITPPMSLTVLRAGWEPVVELVHPSVH